MMQGGRRKVGIVVVALAVGALGWHDGPPIAAGQAYRFLATAESEDQVALIEFRPCVSGGQPTGCGARVLRTYPVGEYPTDTEGPHGVIASRDSRSFYVTLAHGRPFGALQKIDIASGLPSGIVRLGMFPATVDLGVAGELVYVINFNFEDPTMAPSGLSVVDGITMTEVARTTTCRMPHGSRVSSTGTKHYSACMMNDLLVEVDARTFAVTRMLNVAAGHEGPVNPNVFAGFEDTDDSSARSKPLPTHSHDDVSNACSPTWAQPSADGAHVYVACNKSAEIVEAEVSTWRVLRRWSTSPGPYNLAATPDGRLLVATQKGPGTITVWALSGAKLLAELKGSRRIASGVVVTLDSRYAVVTLEGVGGDPGTVDVIDLSSFATVASIDIGKQAGGIALLP